MDISSFVCILLRQILWISHYSGSWDTSLTLIAHSMQSGLVSDLFTLNKFTLLPNSAPQRLLIARPKPLTFSKDIMQPNDLFISLGESNPMLHALVGVFCKCELIFIWDLDPGLPEAPINIPQCGCSARETGCCFECQWQPLKMFDQAQNRAVKLNQCKRDTWYRVS